MGSTCTSEVHASTSYTVYVHKSITVNSHFVRVTSDRNFKIRVRVGVGARECIYFSLQNVVNILSLLVHVVWWPLDVSTMSHVT